MKKTIRLSFIILLLICLCFCFASCNNKPYLMGQLMYKNIAKVEYYYAELEENSETGKYFIYTIIDKEKINYFYDSVKDIEFWTHREVYHPVFNVGFMVSFKDGTRLAFTNSLFSKFDKSGRFVQGWEFYPNRFFGDYSSYIISHGLAQKLDKSEISYLKYDF